MILGWNKYPDSFKGTDICVCGCKCLVLLRELTLVAGPVFAKTCFARCSSWALSHTGFVGTGCSGTNPADAEENRSRIKGKQLWWERGKVPFGGDALLAWSFSLLFSGLSSFKDW